MGGGVPSVCFVFFSASKILYSGEGFLWPIQLHSANKRKWRNVDRSGYERPFMEFYLRQWLRDSGQVVSRANRLSEWRFWKERPRKLVGIGVKTEVLKKHKCSC